MAVRTKQAGIKNKREVGVRSALPATGATRGSKTVPKDEEVAAKRARSTANMKLGPAAKGAVGEYSRGMPATTVNGRKKNPSQMRVKKKGGPRKRSPLHGG